MIPNDAYPLTWPMRPRHRGTRLRASFGAVHRGDFGGHKQGLSIGQARDRLLHELHLMEADSVVISSNLKLRDDGLPYSKQRAVDTADPGVAVYFRIYGDPYCLPSDRWDRIADNLAAVAKHVGAMRGMKRWGVGDLRQAFAGYAALPAQGESDQRPWRNVLGFDASNTPTLAAAKHAYRAAMSEAHPDTGGDTIEAAKIDTAWEQAKQELTA